MPFFFLWDLLAAPLSIASFRGILNPLALEKASSTADASAWLVGETDQEKRCCVRPIRFQPLPPPPPPFHLFLQIFFLFIVIHIDPTSCQGNIRCIPEVFAYQGKTGYSGRSSGNPESSLRHLCTFRGQSATGAVTLHQWLRGWPY